MKGDCHVFQFLQRSDDGALNKWSDFTRRIAFHTLRAESHSIFLGRSKETLLAGQIFHNVAKRVLLKEPPQLCYRHNLFTVAFLDFFVKFSCPRSLGTL